ncbi:MAG: clostripain-related cysteine peptidase [Planctomycetota bacterium]|jgi:hypothetical protein
MRKHYNFGISFFCCLVLVLLLLILPGGCREKKDPIIPWEELTYTGMEVVPETPGGVQSGDVTINYRLRGEGDLQYSVAVEYMQDSDNSFSTATQSSGDNLSALGATHGGIDYSFVWDTDTDIGNATAIVRVRLTVQEPSSGEVSANTNLFLVRNSAAVPKWTIMVYIAGDNDLSDYAVQDINAMEEIGSNDNVSIVVQADFIGFDEFGTAKRYYISQGDSYSITSPVLEDMGEINSGNGQSLSDFIEWAATNFPAEKYCLITWDHGIGWGGGLVNFYAPPLTIFEDYMTLAEMEEGIENGIIGAGIGRLDLLFCHMCLMGAIEAMDAFSPHAKYAVASPELVMGEITNYENILTGLNANPDMGPMEFGTIIADDYVNESQLQYYWDDFRYSYSVMDMDLIPAVTDAFTALLDAVNESGTDDWRMDFLTSAYFAPFYCDLYYVGIYSGYSDLGDFCNILSHASTDPAISGNASLVSQAVSDAVVYYATNMSPTFDSGLSVFVPDTQFYQYENVYEYAQVEFCASTGWSDLSLDLAIFVDLCLKTVTISVPEITGGPIEDNVSVTCSAVMDAFFPMDSGFLVTETAATSPYPNEVVVVFQSSLNNSITMPDGRNIPSWELTGNPLEADWDGTALALSNGATSIPLCATSKSENGTEILTAVVDVWLENGSWFFDTELKFDASNGALISCMVYDWMSLEIFPYDLQNGDTVSPTGLSFDIGPSSWGFMTDYGSVPIVCGPSGLTAVREPVSNGSYYIGFYACDRSGYYTFSRETITINR